MEKDRANCLLNFPREKGGLLRREGGGGVIYRYNRVGIQCQANFLNPFMPESQGLSQDLETGCPKLTMVKFLGILFFKGGNNIYTEVMKTMLRVPFSRMKWSWCFLYN